MTNSPPLSMETDASIEPARIEILRACVAGSGEPHEQDQLGDGHHDNQNGQSALQRPFNSRICVQLGTPLHGMKPSDS